MPVDVADTAISAPGDDATRSYTANGGKSMAVRPDMDEKVADASMYGSGTRRLVSASGKDSHEDSTAGVLVAVSPRAL